MREQRAAIILAFLVVIGAPASGRAGGTAFVHAHLISMEKEGVLDNRTVVVSGEKITAVGADGAVAIPAGATVIDAAGKYLLPGLADMHVHVHEPEDLLLWLRHGVTTVLNLNGFPQHLAWRKALADGTMEGPSLYTAGPTIYEAKDARAGDSLARVYHAAGYDCLKIYNDVAADAYDAIIAAAKKFDMLTVGHIPRAPKFSTVLASGMAVAHAEEFIYTVFRDTADDVTIPAVVRQVKDAGITVIATIGTYEVITKQVENLDSILAQPNLDEVPPWIRSDWSPEKNRYSARRGFRAGRLEQRLAFQKEFLRRLHEAGVRVLVGTDAVFNGMLTGRGTLREIEDLVALGFTPYEALHAATIEGAEFLRASASWGSVAQGKRADLLLLDGNPLEDVTAIERQSGVMARGRWYPEEELRDRCAKLPQRYAEEHDRFVKNLDGDLESAVKYENANDPFNDLLQEAIAAHAAAGDFDRLTRLLRGVYAIDRATWSVRELMINDLGYRIMANKDHLKGAIAVLMLNTALYPSSANTWDSLAEAFLNDGDKENARKYYEAALRVDPAWENAKTMLGKIR